MTESRTIEAQHTIASGKKVSKAADNEVLNHRPIAVEKDHAGGSRIPPLPIMQPHPIAFDKASNWWISPFRYDREHKIPDHHEN
jgi:hypothetical protein